MNFQLDLAAALTSYVPSVLLFPVFTKLLHRWQLMDEPDERKMHTRRTPAYGGLLIFVGYLLSVIIWTPFSEWYHLKFIILTQAIMVLFGLRDDWTELKPLEKLSGQILASFIIIFLVDVRIEGFYGLISENAFHSIPSFGISLLVIIGLINAFNLIDGIDGLAGSIGALALFFFGVWFSLLGQVTFAILSFALLGAIMAFLFFNWQPASIFMGDTGSLFIGVTVATIALKAMNLNYELPSGHFAKFENTITIGLCILCFPIFDTIRVMLIRTIINGTSPFRPDRRHIHHLLVDRGLSHQQVVFLIFTFNLILILAAIIFRNFEDINTLPILLVILLLLSSILNRLKKVESTPANIE